jgi:DNA (cytosine-5)-methyltransferase 1
MAETLIKYIDLFCGIGGFRIAAEKTAREMNFEAECVFSSDIDPRAQETYFANFGEKPFGDITKIDSEDIPAHNLLLAGFPCQPFSIIGSGKGFDDARGTLFFKIARILEAKKPEAFLLENVRRLVSLNKGSVFARIMETLRELGYSVDYRILNALDYGLPQKRERVFIVGFRNPALFIWPKPLAERIPLANILEQDVPLRYFASDEILKKRLGKHKASCYPSIWHENKAGHISSYPYSCALRAGASHNYLLVNGERRLTPREMLRLQGFPDSFKIVVSDSQLRKQAGNAVPIAVVSAILKSLLPILAKQMQSGQSNYRIKAAAEKM